MTIILKAAVWYSGFFVLGEDLCRADKSFVDVELSQVSLAAAHCLIV